MAILRTVTEINNLAGSNPAPGSKLSGTQSMFSNNDAHIYKLERKKVTLRCDRCPPHRKENVEHVPRRSWKFRSKQPNQYKL